MAHDFFAGNVPYVATPLGYSHWWLALAVLLVVLVVLWCVGAVLWTLPVSLLRKIPVLRDITRAVLRKRFAAAVDRVEKSLLTGELAPREAHHRLARTLRVYLHFQTGQRTHVMGLSDIEAGELKPAARAFELVSHGQFGFAENVDVAHTARVVKEVVTSWR
ncbi:MAG: hypothetical protein ACRC20_00050 [Segniliparus sp.]|uniref:hypothetical protein n=1 Tax=Segniliparus sp. TaxID=2804064 RepID=UPI003F325813